MTEPPAFVKAADALEEDSKADVLLLCGPIDRSAFQQVQAACMSRTNPTVILVLITDGGDPHAAYRIARALKRIYERLIVLVPDRCKSAGTLIALGADEVSMTDMGELGPLDIQLESREQLGARNSGNDLTFGMAHLVLSAFSDFYECFGSLGTNLETQVAAEAASSLVGQLYGPVFQSVRPNRVGAVVRSNRIGSEYAERLLPAGDKTQAAINRLVHSYPAHGFVIDREEAASFLPQVVRKPTESESTLATSLRGFEPTSTLVFLKLAPWPVATQNDKEGLDDADVDDTQPAEGSSGGPEGSSSGGTGNGNGGENAGEGERHSGAKSPEAGSSMSSSERAPLELGSVSPEPARER